MKKIMTVLTGTTFGLFLLLVSPGTLLATPFDLTAASADFGVPAEGSTLSTMSATVSGLTLDLYAMSWINIYDNTQASLKDGQIWYEGSKEQKTAYTLVNMEAMGTGVRHEIGAGSGGISGKGGRDDEALIMTFSTPIVASSFELTLSDYTTANDQVLIYLDPDPVNTPSLLPELVEVGTVEAGDIFKVDFSGLSGTFTTLYVRNTHVDGGSGEEFFVSGVNATAGNPTPEPATMLLLGAGLVGFAGFRRKFRS